MILKKTGDMDTASYHRKDFFMWLIFAVLSFLLYSITDIFGKKSVDEGDVYTPLELIVTVSMLSFIISIALYGFGFGESGMTPWQLLRLHPLILANLLCVCLYWIFFLLSMKFIRLSISEAVSSSFGIFYFVGLILINLCLGKLPTVHEILHPLRLIPILLVLSFIVLYPSEKLSKRINTLTDDTGCKIKRSRYIVGISILLFSMLMDSLDSLIITWIFGEGTIGFFDYIMTMYFFLIYPATVLFIFLRIKRKKWFIPLKRSSVSYAGYAVSSLLSSQLFMVASHYDAVRTGILFIIYPILPIIGAKILLKEKFTHWQNLCIWIITLSAIAFCVSDYLL